MSCACARKLQGVGRLRLVKKSVVFSDGCEIGSVCAEIQCVLEDNSKLLVHSVSH